jgi:phosphatidylserine decarboxylase
MVLRYFIISISFILFFFVLQFFRNPIVKIPYNDKHILAPADGKVVVVEKTIEQECLKDERIQISIFMSPVNVHVSRSPASGKIKYFKYHPGKYLVAWHPKSSILNERTTMLLTLKDGLDIVVRQIAGIMARRIKYYVQEGDNLEQGAEFGFIRFGSRLDVFLPTNADVLVKPGMVTRAGKTVLAAIKG